MKGKLIFVLFFGRHGWLIRTTGFNIYPRCSVGYSSKESARRAAKRVAKRLGIELKEEVSNG